MNLQDRLLTLLQNLCPSSKADICLKYASQFLEYHILHNQNLPLGVSHIYWPILSIRRWNDVGTVVSQFKVWNNGRNGNLLKWTPVFKFRQYWVWNSEHSSVNFKQRLSVSVGYKSYCKSRQLICRFIGLWASHTSIQDS